MSDHRGYRPDPFAIAAFLFSIVSAAIAFMHYIDYSEIELLPLDQVVIVLDDRREASQATVIAPEISVFNRASGSYSDAIRSASFEAASSDGARFCFRDLAYSRLHIDGERLGERLARATVPGANELDDRNTPVERECENVECIRAGVEDEFLLVTLDEPIPQTIPPGGIFSHRIAFVSQACGGEERAPSFDEMLDAMMGSETRVSLTIHTLKDGDHSTSCDLASLPEEARTFGRREHFLALACTPTPGPKASLLDQLRTWLDGLI